MSIHETRPFFEGFEIIETNDCLISIFFKYSKLVSSWILIFQILGTSGYLRNQRIAPKLVLPW
jgi:hypothetical protein